MAVTVSERPWSDYTKADYTPEQWHAACLIHQHEGPPTSKDQCKLPVRTPTGTLNRNGVFAAAAALAGARGGVNASPEEKAKAASALLRYYKQLDAEPPPSLRHDATSGLIARFATELFHFGVKGMKWGVRREDTGGGTSGASTKVGQAGKTHLSADAERFLKTRAKQEHEMSDREIREANNRAQAIKQYNQTFNDPNGPLRQKVESLQLQKSYQQLNREMNPTAMDRAVSAGKRLGQGYQLFKKLDAESGGLLSKNLKGAFAAKPPTAPGTSKPTSKGPFRVNPAKVKITPTSGIPTRGKGYRINPNGSLSVVPEDLT